jgi:hypothetical protein
MSEDDGLKAMGQVIQIDEARIRDHLGEMVRGTVEEMRIGAAITARRSHLAMLLPLIARTGPTAPV